jgi:hypothetical protein
VVNRECPSPVPLTGLSNFLALAPSYRSAKRRAVF